jgi:hypothetical protein
MLAKIAKQKLGTSMTASILAEEGRITLNKILKNRSRIKLLNRVFKESNNQIKLLIQTCLDHMRPITAPLVLISQIQRSGGTLLSQLFDGHPEVHAHPNELMIGYPKKHIWPKIDLDDGPEQWFEVLFEDMVTQHLKEGYKKGKKHNETYPFIFLPSLQREVFLKYIRTKKSVTLRDVIDAYMTSYFGAWINNQNTNGIKKFITAFTPRLAMYEESLMSFFEVYPDGRIISIIRNPKNWYPSAVRHGQKRYGEIKNALAQWIDSANAMIRNKDRYKDRLCVIKFEDLVNNTQAVMQYIAEILQIEFNDILLIPTFNKSPIKANTSFQSDKYGIIQGTLSRYKTLDPDELKIIEDVTKEVYQSVLNRVVSF